jgi:CO dehydrogenase/acetyl-CoA synthase gamma subunit (corrinoid Fe-S protein)
VVEYVGNAGHSFVSKTGMPKTTDYKSYKLDTVQIKRLEIFLTEQPCTDSIRLEKACAPTFKNVFVFYDENKKPIAVIHICFHCEMTVFNPDEDYMCDFDNKVNYKELKNFVDSIKQN